MTFSFHENIHVFVVKWGIIYDDKFWVVKYFY